MNIPSCGWLFVNSVIKIRLVDLYSLVQVRNCKPWSCFSPKKLLITKTENIIKTRKFS